MSLETSSGAAARMAIAIAMRRFEMFRLLACRVIKSARGSGTAGGKHEDDKGGCIREELHELRNAGTLKVILNEDLDRFKRRKHEARKKSSSRAPARNDDCAECDKTASR